jgi:ATP-binding cassette, subfamily C (CFTR/MRP), member 1
VLLGFAFLASLADLGIIVFHHVPVPVLQSYILESVALLLIWFLVYTNHTRSRTSSSVVLLFWPPYLLGLAVWFRTLLLMHPHASQVETLFVLRCVVAGTGLASFALELIAPKFEFSIDDDNEFDEGHVPNPILTANIFSKWFFSYMTPLMKKGTSTTITDADLPSLVKSDRAIELANRLKNAMLNQYVFQCQHAKCLFFNICIFSKSLYVSLFVAYGGPYAFAALLKIICDCFSFLQPQLLRWLLSFITRYTNNHSIDGPSPYEGFSIAVLMFITSIIQTIIMHQARSFPLVMNFFLTMKPVIQYFQICFETGLRVRAGLVTTVYEKALRLSNDGQGKSTGEIVSLMSVDCTRLQDFCTYGLVLVSGTFQIVLAFVSLYDLLGWSAFVGVGIMVRRVMMASFTSPSTNSSQALTVPLNTLIARTLKKMQTTQMKNRDRRTKLMSELLNNIKS